MEPCPADRTNRSRLNHCGFLGLYLRNLVQRVKAIAAAPMGKPGWPEFAYWTASAESIRMVLIHCSSSSRFSVSLIVSLQSRKLYHHVGWQSQDHFGRLFHRHLRPIQ